jgi:hypothetical protein
MKASGIISLAALMVAAGISGCATRMKPNDRVRVYVTPSGAVTFAGETFVNPEELPKRLIKAGATPQNEIYIVTQGEVKDEKLLPIVAACGRGGLPNVVISDKRPPSSFAREKGDDFNVKTSTKPPRFIPPGAKSKPQRKATPKRDKKPSQ